MAGVYALHRREDAPGAGKVRSQNNGEEIDTSASSFSAVNVSFSNNIRGLGFRILLCLSDLYGTSYGILDAEEVRRWINVGSYKYLSKAVK